MGQIIKFIFLAIIFTWIFRAVINIIRGIFPKKQSQNSQNNNTSKQPHKSKIIDKDIGEYVDYEEVDTNK